MKILLSGGGTLGPVTPLIALYEAWSESATPSSFLWVGTKRGPERIFVERLGIRFIPLSAPKLSRHAPGQWLFIPLHLLWSVINAWRLLNKERPDAVVSAGGYVSVPVVWAASFLGIPVWIHQQDVRTGLANRLMAPTASRVSVAWPKSLADFPSSKTILLGNPVRGSLRRGSRERAVKIFGLKPDQPTVLIIGGGTGAQWINRIISQITSELLGRANLIHLTGPGKKESGAVIQSGFYLTEQLVEEMADAIAAADLIVCRAGMGTISELAALSKAVIFIPIPDSHQEDNARILQEAHAAIILKQSETSPQVLLEKIFQFFSDPSLRAGYGRCLHNVLMTDGAAERLASLIRELVREEKT